MANSTASHPTLPPATTIQLYRIVQEALNNVYKHAGAQRVTIRCAQIDQQVQISIHDDGRGFDPAQHNTAPLEGLGLRSMQARAEALGGSLTVTAQRGQGTHIAIQLPLTAPTPQGRRAPLRDGARLRASARFPWWKRVHVNRSRHPTAAALVHKP